MTLHNKKKKTIDICTFTVQFQLSGCTEMLAMNKNVHKVVKNYFTQVFASLVIMENNAKERKKNWVATSPNFK